MKSQQAVGLQCSLHETQVIKLMIIFLAVCV